MSVLTEAGSLIIGVEHGGELHKDFEIREQLVMNHIAVFEDPATAERAEKSDAYFGVALMASRIIRLGSIPKEAITAEMLMGMHQRDYNELVAADGRLAEKRSRFQG
mgnify:CR=1 FL=1